MRSLRICLLALTAALLLGAPSAQADTTMCDMTWPTFGNVHRFVGQPLTYDLTNNGSHFFDVIAVWGDGASDIGSFNPGVSHEFSHSYAATGTYDVLMVIEVADPTDPLGVCKQSFDAGTVRVKGRGPH